MTQTKRLSELKPGDHMYWEGDLRKIISVERNANSHASYAVHFEGDDSPEALAEGNWAVPSDEEVAELYRKRKEWSEWRRRDLAENWTRHEAKCMAAARRVAIALGKDPELAEKQMREELDAKLSRLKAECGE